MKKKLKGAEVQEDNTKVEREIVDNEVFEVTYQEIDRVKVDDTPVIEKLRSFIRSQVDEIKANAQEAKDAGVYADRIVQYLQDEKLFKTTIK